MYSGRLDILFGTFSFALKLGLFLIIFQGFFLASYLLTKKRTELENFRWLPLFTILGAFSLFILIAFRLEFYNISNERLIALSHISLVLMGFTYSIFIREIHVRKDKVFVYSSLLYPITLSGILFYMVFYFMGFGFFDGTNVPPLDLENGIFYTTSNLTILVILFYYRLFIWLIKKNFPQQIDLSNSIANSYGQSFDVLLFFALMEFLGSLYLENYNFHFLFIAVAIFLHIGILTFYLIQRTRPEPLSKNDHFNLDQELVKKESVKYLKTGLNRAISQELNSKLISLMEEEELYKDQNINLNMLSEKMNLSRHHTSQLINQEYNMGYHEFINSYRIEEAKKLLANNSNNNDGLNLNISQVAFESGFNTRASFYNCFKKVIGSTPKEYIATINTSSMVS